MAKIEIQQSTVERLAQVQALTGGSVDQVVDAALGRELAYQQLKAAVQLGVEQAERGQFVDQSLDEMFAEILEEVEREHGRAGLNG